MASPAPFTRRSSLADTRGVGLAVWISFFWLEETLSLCPQIPGGCFSEGAEWQGAPWTE